MMRKIRSLFMVEGRPKSEAKDDIFFAPKQLSNFLRNGNPEVLSVNHENRLTPADVSVTRNILPLLQELALHPENPGIQVLPLMRKLDGEPEVCALTLPDFVVFAGNYSLRVPTEEGIKFLSYGSVHWMGKSQTTLLPNGERQKGYLPSCAVYVLFDNSDPENRVASVTVNNQRLAVGRQPITNIELQTGKMEPLMKTLTTGQVLSADVAQILIAETLAQAVVALERYRNHSSR